MGKFSRAHPFHNMGLCCAYIQVFRTSSYGTETFITIITKRYPWLESNFSQFKSSQASLSEDPFQSSKTYICMDILHISLFHTFFHLIQVLVSRKRNFRTTMFQIRCQKCMSHTLIKHYTFWCKIQNFSLISSLVEFNIFLSTSFKHL
jgi:hypothetical protein